MQEQPCRCTYCNRDVPKSGLELHVQKYHVGKEASRKPLVEAFNRRKEFDVARVETGESRERLETKAESWRSERQVKPVVKRENQGETRQNRSDSDSVPIGPAQTDNAHMADQPLNCPYCDHVFTTDNSFQKHVCSQHPEHSETVWSDQLEYNSYIHIMRDFRPFLCLLCSRTFRRKATMKEHVAIMHVGQTMRFPFAKRSPQTAGIQCVACHKGFTLETLQMHACSGNSVEEKPVPMRKDIDPNGSTVCRKRDYLRVLIRNTERKRSQTTNFKKEHICEVCGSRFQKPSRLQDHLLVHTNMRPYTCKYCNKTLKSKRSLRTHLLTLHKLPADNVDKIVSDLPDIQPEFVESSNEPVKKQHLAPAKVSENCPICQDEVCADSQTLDCDFVRQHIWAAHVPNVPSPSALLTYWTLTSRYIRLLPFPAFSAMCPVPLRKNCRNMW